MRRRRLPRRDWWASRGRWRSTGAGSHVDEGHGAEPHQQRQPALRRGVPDRRRSASPSGSYTTTAGPHRALEAQWSAGAWSLAPGSLGGTTFGIDCTAATTCASVGQMDNGGLVLTQRWPGGGSGMASTGVSALARRRLPHPQRVRRGRAAHGHTVPGANPHHAELLTRRVPYARPMRTGGRFGRVLVVVALACGLLGLTPLPASAASGPGPGHVTLTFVDRSRPTVDPTGPAARRRARSSPRCTSRGQGPFPLVVFAHGNAGNRASSPRCSRRGPGPGTSSAAPTFPLTNDLTGVPTVVGDFVNQPATSAS